MFAACDHIDQDDRLTYVEPPEVKRAVLIEDFTGQRCVNCPRATTEIERLQEEFGDSVVIAVAIHSGPFGKTVKGEPTPLYTTTGDEYFNHWGLDAQPIGLIDRLEGAGFEYTDWAAGVHYELEHEPPVTILIENDYDDESGMVYIDVESIGVSESTVNGKLQVWLIEDSITNYQLMPDGSTNEQYMHMHVFRTSVNDIWGDAISLNQGDDKIMSYSLTLDAEWRPEHCSIVAFIYNDEGVKQVVKQKII